jgi:hypothetical protein
LGHAATSRRGLGETPLRKSQWQARICARGMEIKIVAVIAINPSKTIGTFMARFDFHNNDYEWGFTFTMGGHLLFFESPSRESSDGIESDPLARAKPVQKKVTRQIRRTSAGSNSLFNP